MLAHTSIISAVLWLLFPRLAESTVYITSNTSTPRDNNDNCTCYVVKSGADSNSPEYFQFYRFYDFRNFADQAGQYVTSPPLANDSQTVGTQSVWEPDILNSYAWTTDWGIQNWSKSATEDFPTSMANSPANVYIQQTNGTDPFTYLALRTSRLRDFQSAAEIENRQRNLMHLSMRLSGRVVGGSGAVAGFFTYFDDSNESDVEILTRDPSDVIHYTNQPSLDKHRNVVQAASKAPSNLPPWNQWRTHRIDWLDKNSYWYLDNKQVAANTYSVPRKPSGLTINMWSDGGEWSGNMSVGDSAEFQIQYIEMTFNTSGPVQGPKSDSRRRDVGILEERKKTPGCEVVCKIDGVKTLGTPEVVSVNLSKAAEVTTTWIHLLFVGCISLWVGL